MYKITTLTFILALICASTQAQQSEDSNNKKLKISVEYGQHMGILHQIVGVSTTQHPETGETTKVENISESFGCGASPGITLDYSLTKNIQVGFAGDYIFGRHITTNELIRGGSTSESIAWLSALRIAPRISLTTEIANKLDWFVRVGVDLVFMAEMKEESNIPFSMFEDFIDPSLFPPDALGDISTTTTTTGKFAPGLAFQTGIHYRLNDRFGLQLAVEYRGYNFTTKHSEIEIEDPNGVLGFISSVPFLSQTDYVESLGGASNNETMRNPEDLNLFAPREDLQQKKPASSLGLRIGFSIWL